MKPYCVLSGNRLSLRMFRSDIPWTKTMDGEVNNFIIGNWPLLYGEWIMVVWFSDTNTGIFYSANGMKFVTSKASGFMLWIHLRAVSHLDNSRKVIGGSNLKRCAKVISLWTVQTSLLKKHQIYDEYCIFFYISGGFHFRFCEWWMVPAKQKTELSVTFWMTLTRFGTECHVHHPLTPKYSSKWTTRDF